MSYRASHEPIDAVNKELARLRGRASKVLHTPFPERCKLWTLQTEWLTCDQLRQLVLDFNDTFDFIHSQRKQSVCKLAS